MSESPSARPLGPVVADHAAPWPGKPTLKGSYVTLVPLSTSHTNDLFKAFSGEANAYLWDYVRDGPYYDLETFAASIDAYANHKEITFFAIVNPQTDEAVGYIGLMNINPANRSIEIGNVLFSAKMQRSPASTEAVYLLLCYTFDELGYRRVEWETNALNAKSRRAAARLGFSLEGIFRSHKIIKGRNRDTAWFSMLDSEWPMIKQSFKKWLAADNFDETGKQMSTLQAFRK